MKLQLARLYRNGLIFAIGLLLSALTNLTIEESPVLAAANQDLIIYDDGLAAGWQDWSWDTTVNFDQAGLVYSGAAAAAITFKTSWAGFSVRAPVSIDTTEYTDIAFWIYGSGDTHELDLSTQATDNGAPSPVYRIQVTGGSWTQLVVPLSTLGNPTAIARLTLQDTGGGAPSTFYVDDLRLVRDTSSNPPLPSGKIDLWRDGPHLRGANIHQRRSYPFADGDLADVSPVIPPYIQADFDKLAALGANYVNVSHPGLFSETAPFTVDQDIQANLDNLLTMIEQANLYAVISFRTGPGRNEFIFLNEEDPNWLGVSKDIDFVWTDQAAQDGWVAMWRYTAERYRDHPNVVGYDLMVEPNANKLLNIWKPDDFYPDYAGTLYDWNQFYPDISAAIREVDSQTPILIGAMSYSAASWLPALQPTGDPRTVYLVHTYEPFGYTHQNPPLNLTYPGTFDGDGDGQADQINKAWLEETLAPVDLFQAIHNVPVAVNEYGLQRWQPGGAQYLADQMALFEDRGLNHAWWLWGPSDERFVEYTHFFNPRLGPDPANRQEVTTSALLEVIKQNWALNQMQIYQNFHIFLPFIISP